MRAAVYLRVSTEEQTEANQEPDCLRICQQRGWEPIVIREKMSGAKKRPGWEQVLGLVHRADVAAVVVWAMDRAGRNRVQLAHDIAEIARKRCAFVSVRESWIDQPEGPVRDFLIQAFAWFAESERVRLIERTKAGQDRARAQGKHIGRKWLDAAKVEEIHEHYLAGVSSFVTARDTGFPESTVRTYYARWKNGFNGYPRQVSPKAGA